MRTSAKSLLAYLCVGFAGALGIAEAQAQNMMLPGAETVALKSGESQEISDLYFVSNCMSLLNTPLKLRLSKVRPGSPLPSRKTWCYLAFKSAQAK